MGQVCWQFIGQFWAFLGNFGNFLVSFCVKLVAEKITSFLWASETNFGPFILSELYNFTIVAFKRKYRLFNSQKAQTLTKNIPKFVFLLTGLKKENCDTSKNL